jgi:hypothetical protein
MSQGGDRSARNDLNNDLVTGAAPSFAGLFAYVQDVGGWRYWPNWAKEVAGTKTFTMLSMACPTKSSVTRSGERSATGSSTGTSTRPRGDGDSLPADVERHVK